MKKLGLFLVMVMLYTGLYANTERRPVRYRMNEPVKITVRSIDFFIFPNGEFDFNAHNRRQRHHRRGDYGVRVERNRYGKIRRVGNVYINYNRHGQVSRIGNVFIKYNRRGLVHKIGRKRIDYRKHGYVVFNIQVGVHPAYVSNETYYYGPEDTYNDVAYYDNYEDEYYDDYTPVESGNYYFKPHLKKKIIHKIIKGDR